MSKCRPVEYSEPDYNINNGDSYCQYVSPGGCEEHSFD